MAPSNADQLPDPTPLPVQGPPAVDLDAATTNDSPKRSTISDGYLYREAPVSRCFIVDGELYEQAPVGY